jgi:hypothetical protein
MKKLITILALILFSVSVFSQELTYKCIKTVIYFVEDSTKVSRDSNFTIVLDVENKTVIYNNTGQNSFYLSEEPFEKVYLTDEDGNNYIRLGYNAFDERRIVCNFYILDWETINSTIFSAEYSDAKLRCECIIDIK